MCERSISNLDEEIKSIKMEVKQTDTIKVELKKLNELILKVGDDDKRDKILLKISQLEKELKQFECIRQPQTISELVKKHQCFNIKIEQLNATLDYLYPNFIAKGEITLVAAPPASGKSLISLKLADLFLSTKNVRYIYYFDFDNSFVTLKERRLDELYKKYNENLIYIHPQNINDSEFNNLIVELHNCNLFDVLMVFDTAKNFLKGDRDKNKDVSTLMKIFKKLRDAGSTIILLHHTNKPNNDLKEITYAGSSAWAEDASNAFILRKNDFQNSFLFSVFKDRVGHIKDKAFKIENERIQEVDFEEATVTEEDQQANIEIINYIEKHDKCSYTQILTHIMNLGYAKDRVNKIIQSGKNKYWNSVKNKANHNSDEYSLKENTNISVVTDLS